MGTISVRDSIRWVPDDASEPTSTIVLTSPQRRFVDLRILHSTSDNESDESQTSRSRLPGELKGYTITNMTGTLPLSRLDWGIAGTSSSFERDDGRGGKISCGRWTHWVDSRTKDAENATDEGDEFEQPGGLVLEKGSMVNPATGSVTDYEEVWRSVKPRGSGNGVRYVVLETQNEPGTMRGRVVRLGQFCQGLLRDGDEITVERWEEGDEGWKKTVMMGQRALACEKAVKEETEWCEGATVEVDGYLWKVVETGWL